jgi:hypothetical protein
MELLNVRITMCRTAIHVFFNLLYEMKKSLKHAIAFESICISFTVGAQSIARAQSIAPRHSTYVIMPKKPKFRKFLFGKIKKEDFARRFFKKKNSVFSRLKVLNKHFSTMLEGIVS